MMGFGDAIDHQRYRYCQTHQRRIHPNQLLVVEQKQDRPPHVHKGIGALPDTERGHGAHRQPSRCHALLLSISSSPRVETLPDSVTFLALYS